MYIRLIRFAFYNNGNKTMLSTNKSPSIDNIIYEYFKESIDFLDKPLQTNFIFTVC